MGYLSNHHLYSYTKLKRQDLTPLGILLLLGAVQQAFDCQETTNGIKCRLSLWSVASYKEEGLGVMALLSEVTETVLGQLGDRGSLSMVQTTWAIPVGALALASSESRLLSLFQPWINRGA